MQGLHLDLIFCYKNKIIFDIVGLIVSFSSLFEFNSIQFSN